MSDSYHYEDGAIHNDHKRVLHIDKVQGADLQQLIRGFFKEDAEEAEVVEEEVEVQSASQQKNVSCFTEEHYVDDERRLAASRKKIWQQLQALVEKGDWMPPMTAEGIRQVMTTALGTGRPLTDKEMEGSRALWQLLENGRSDRVRVVWQNFIGYFAERGFLPAGMGSPALNKMFFGPQAGDYQNIDKGRRSETMSNGFRDVVPLIDSLLG